MPAPGLTAILAPDGTPVPKAFRYGRGTLDQEGLARPRDIGLSSCIWPGVRRRGQGLLHDIQTDEGYVLRRDLPQGDARCVGGAKQGAPDAVVGFLGGIFIADPQDKDHILSEAVTSHAENIDTIALYLAGLPEEAKNYAAANGLAEGPSAPNVA